MAACKISANSIQQLQNYLGDLPEDDCKILLEEYGNDTADVTKVIQDVYDVLESYGFQTVSELVWNIRQNPCFGSRQSRSLHEKNSIAKDSWIMARSRSSNTINKHVSGLPMAVQPRASSATAQMESNSSPPQQPLPYSGTRNPIRIARVPKGIDANVLLTFLSKYMQDKETSNTLYEIRDSPTLKLLILLRGVSGSGKSTLASVLWSITEHGEICSADHYFMNRNGEYNFNKSSLTEAHESCRNHCRLAMIRGDTPIVIDNTNTKVEEMMPYVQMAVEFNYDVKLLEPNTEWKKKAGILAQKNIHGVTKRTIENQLSRFEKVTAKMMVDRVLRTQVKSNYKPNPDLEWGSMPSSSTSSSLDSWTQMATTLNSVAFPTPISNNHQAPKIPALSKSKMSPTSQSFTSQPQQSWIEPTPIRPPSPIRLSDLVPDLKNSSGTPKSKRAGKETNNQRNPLKVKEKGKKNGGGNTAPAAAPSPIKAVVFEDPAHAAFNRLQKLFPFVDKDKLELMFNSHGGDMDECAFTLFKEGHDIAEIKEEPKPELETVVPQTVKTDAAVAVSSDQFEELLKLEYGADVTGASGGNSDACDQQPQQHVDNVPDYEEAESITYDFNDDNLKEPEIVEDETDSFEMNLPIEFARLLLSAFSHPEDENLPLSLEQLTIKVSADTAFELYKSLYINMHKAENESPRNGSEESTRSSSPTSSNNDDEFDAIAISLSQMELETNSTDPQLASIIQLESKISRHTQESLRCYTAPYRTMAQNIQFSILKQEFPYLDAAVVDEVYCQCYLNVEKTRRALIEICPSVTATAGSSKETQTENKWNLKYNPKDIQLYSPEELRSMQRTYEELEKEWSSQMAKIKDYYEKCKTMNNPQIKAHYITEAKKLSDEMKALSDEMQYYKAISLNAKHKNDQILDLHGLKINGAMRVLKEFLQCKEEEFKNAGIPKMILLIITGQGKHSKNGCPVLQPAVRNFLSQRNYKFFSAKLGTYSIVLTRGSLSRKK